MIRIPAFLADGIAVSSNRLAALLPAPSAGRPKYVDRKKFCISMITKAVLEGEIMIGVVVVEREIDSFREGTGYSGGEGRVKSNIGGDEEWSQQLG